MKHQQLASNPKGSNKQVCCQSMDPNAQEWAELMMYR